IVQVLLQRFAKTGVGRVQVFLRSVFEQCNVERLRGVGRDAASLFEDVADALEAHSQRLKVGRRADFRDGHAALNGIDRVIVGRGQNGVDLVVGEAAVV